MNWFFWFPVIAESGWSKSDFAVDENWLVVSDGFSVFPHHRMIIELVIFEMGDNHQPMNDELFGRLPTINDARC